MKFEITDYSIRIIPETPQDKSYLKFVLGLDDIDSKASARPHMQSGGKEIWQVVLQKGE